MYSEKYWLTVFAIISLSLGCNEQASKIGLQSTGFIQVRQAKLHYVVEGNEDVPFLQYNLPPIGYLLLSQKLPS